jgi:hypothetical protein
VEDEDKRATLQFFDLLSLPDIARSTERAYCPLLHKKVSSLNVGPGADVLLIDRWTGQEVWEWKTSDRGTRSKPSIVADPFSSFWLVIQRANSAQYKLALAIQPTRPRASESGHSKIGSSSLGMALSLSVAGGRSV